KEAHERIKRRSRVRIQQRVAQTRLADLTQRQVRTLVASVAEAHFPVPRLEIISEFSHLTFQTNVEQVIPVSELLTSEACILDGAKPDSSTHGDWNSVNSQCRIPYSEGIKRIGDWHTDAGRTESYAGSRNLKRIGRERRSREG